MIEVWNLDVLPNNIRYLTVTWQIKPTTETVSDYEFVVLRSISPAGPFDELVRLTDQFVYHDADINLLNRFRIFYYKIRVELKSDASQFDNSEVGYLPRKPDKVAMEIVRKERDILLKKFVGTDVCVYQMRTFGQVCSECWDGIRSRKKTADCGLCFNTGFAGGYLTPIKIRMNFNPSQKIVTQAGFESQPETTTAWCSNFPIMQPKDVIIESGSKRWRVVNVNQTEKRRLVVHQIVQIKRINQSDIEYHLPYKSLIED